MNAAQRDRGWCSLGVEALTYLGHCYDKTVWVTRILFCNSAALCSTNTRPFCLKESSSVTWWTHCPVQTHFMLLISSPPPFFFSFLPPKPSPTSFTPHEHSRVAQCHLLSCSLPIWVTGAALHWPAAEPYGGSKVRSLIWDGMFHCLDRRVSDSTRKEDSLTHTHKHTPL